MIAPHGNRPTLLLPDGRNTLYSKKWLKDCAAELSGFTGEQAEDVAAALSFYLQHEHESSVIKLAEIEALLNLCGTKLQSVRGDSYQDPPTSQSEPNTSKKISPPPAHLYLADIAISAGSTYEIGFFEKLHKALAHPNVSQSTELHVWGLHTAINYMINASSTESQDDSSQSAERRQRALEKEIRAMVQNHRSKGACCAPLETIYEEQ